MGCRFFRLKHLVIIALVIICSAMFLLERGDYSLVDVSISNSEPGARYLVDVLERGDSSLVDVAINNSQPEARKFAFMKNHKCASTTIENIIFRFAYKHQLKLVIPAEGNYLSRTTLFDRSTALKKAKWKDVEFDVFALHNRWNYNEVKALLGDRIPTFTIVRDPVDAFLSMFHFQPDFKKYYRVADIHAFVAKVKAVGNDSYMNRRWLGIVGRNQMAWDLGLSPSISSNMHLVDREIKRLDSEFDLVMIASRMDESLILLRDLLHWPTENIVHLNLNRRKQSTPPLSDEERQILREWLAADARIYDYFSKRFEERITAANGLKSHGRDTAKTYVQTEVETLQAVNRELYKTCVLAEVGNEMLQGKFKEGIDTITGYVINEEVEGCELFALSEPAYLDIFKAILLQSVENSTVS